MLVSPTPSRHPGPFLIRVLLRVPLSSPAPLGHLVFLSFADYAMFPCYYTDYFFCTKRRIPPFTALGILLIVQVSSSLASLPSGCPQPDSTEETVGALKLGAVPFCSSEKYGEVWSPAMVDTCIR